MSPANGPGTPNPEQHPDLDDEVAKLSNKLINAINHQTNLDDTLSRTRIELEEAREKVRQLEEQTKQQREMLAGDVWVRRKSVETERSKLLSRVAEEKKGRLEMEQEKKRMEQELENLTAALFEEANKMVIVAKEEAKKEQDVLHKKNESLRAQLADNEGLLRSQQDQLVELKHVMEQMSTERDDQTAVTAPSSPGFSKFDSKDDDRAGSEGASIVGPSEPISPSHPMSFTHLLQPILRTDLNSFEDFVSLVRMGKHLYSRSRPASGNHSALAAIGLGLAANGSAASIPSPGSVVGSPSTPNTPATAGSTTSAPIASISLKDTKFFKRALAEDIDPTLRLDIAPGLSWLARRSVLGAMTDGSLVVEPLPSQPQQIAQVYRPQFHACALCGESRKEEEHLRTHRFRTSESDSAQRYALCKYCLGRVRSTCDFLGFLRMVKDGHWRADDEDAEKAAWEESVRLREQMFWSRIGGGVLPTGAATTVMSPTASVAAKSPRLGTGEEEEEVELAVRNLDLESPPPQEQGKNVQSTPAKALPSLPMTPPSQTGDSTPSASAADSEKSEPKRLSLQIPGGTS